MERKVFAFRLKIFLKNNIIIQFFYLKIYSFILLTLYLMSYFIISKQLPIFLRWTYFCNTSSTLLSMTKYKSKNFRIGFKKIKIYIYNKKCIRSLLKQSRSLQICLWYKTKCFFSTDVDRMVFTTLLYFVLKKKNTLPLKVVSVNVVVSCDNILVLLHVLTTFSVLQKL